MNREIKYKYYVVRENGFVFSRTFDIRQIELGESERWLEVNHAGDISKTLKRCEYTGLKDKNGVDIYEGDIIQFITKISKGYFYDGIKVTLEVLYGEHNTTSDTLHDAIGFYCKRNKNDETSLRYILKHIDCEVIGNIYENPELLK